MRFEGEGGNKMETNNKNTIDAYVVGIRKIDASVLGIQKEAIRKIIQGDDVRASTLISSIMILNSHLTMRHYEVDLYKLAEDYYPILDKLDTPILR